MKHLVVEEVGVIDVAGDNRMGVFLASSDKEAVRAAASLWGKEVVVLSVDDPRLAAPEQTATKS